MRELLPFQSLTLSDERLSKLMTRACSGSDRSHVNRRTGRFPQLVDPSTMESPHVSLGIASHTLNLTSYI
jgi:hypothetical protein